MNATKRADPAKSQNPPAAPPTAKQEKASANATPYHRAARGYIEKGWSPIPLPHKKKSPPPSGYTGYTGAYVGLPEAQAWAKVGGGNVALRMPDIVLGLDVDAYNGKNGAATLSESEGMLGPLPLTWRSTARPEDPVSGIRYFRVPAGRQWADRLGDNVEVIHHGHRYAVAAPSVHPEGGEYGWYEPDGMPTDDVPSVAELPALPDAWVDALDKGAVGDRPAKTSLGESETGEWLETLPTGDPCPSVLDALGEAEKALSNGSSRHDTARGFVLRLVRLGEQGHTGATTALDTLEGMWLAALHDREPGWGEWERMVSGAVGMALGDPTPNADKGCCPEEDEDGKKLALSVRLRRHVEAHYDAFPAGADGRIFVQSKQGGRAELLTKNFVIRAAGHLGENAGGLTAPATEAATVLTARAMHAPPRVLALRAHYQPGRIVLDLAQTNSTRCVVVTPEGWKVQDVPPRDVVFQSAGAALPTPERGGSVDDLRRLLRWRADDPRWLLVKGWLPASLLARAPRPVLFLQGSMGSSKSTTGRILCGVLDPKPDGTLGGGFGKKRSDDETKALKSYIPGWDNVSSLSDEGADFLSRMVTGDLIEKRMLYSDADLVSISYRRTGVITGVTMPRGVKPDTLDRLILLALPRFEGERVPEEKMSADWEYIRPRVLAGVLDLAVQMLAGLPTAENPAQLRMADYAGALWAIDPALYDAYRDNVASARGDMANDDPFVGTLHRMLLSLPNRTWEGTAEDLQQAGISFVHGQEWWPKGGRSLSDALTRSTELLLAVGISLEEWKGGGKRKKRLTLAEPGQSGAAAGAAGTCCGPCGPLRGPVVRRRNPSSEA